MPRIVARKKGQKRRSRGGWFFSVCASSTEEPRFYSAQVAVERLGKWQETSISYGSRNDGGRRLGKRSGRRSGKLQKTEAKNKDMVDHS